MQSYRIQFIVHFISFLLMVFCLRGGDASEWTSAPVERSVDGLVEEAMRGALRRDARTVRAAADAVKSLDEACLAKGQSPSGLPAPLMALAAAVAPDRNTRRAWQNEALADSGDPYLRAVIKDDLRGDLLATYDRLGWNDAWNRAVLPLNVLVKIISDSLLGIASLRPGSLLLAPLDLAFDMPNPFAFSDFQSKRMVLAERAAREDELRQVAPDSVLAAAARYRARAGREEMKADIRLADSLVESGRFEEAMALCEGVLKRDPSTGSGQVPSAGSAGSPQAGSGRVALASKAREVISKAEAARSLERRRQIAAQSVTPNDDWPETDDVAATYTGVLRSLVLTDAAALAEIPRSFQTSLETAGFGGGISYLDSVARDWESRRGEALEALRAAARERGTISIRVKALLSDAGYCPSADVARARAAVSRQRRAAVFRNLAPGGEEVPRYGSGTPGSEATAGADAGVGGVFGALIGAVEATLLPKVSLEPVMDALARSLREHPGVLEEPPCRAELARLYERAGLYGPALEQYELAGALNERRRQSLREGEAEAARRAIERIPDAGKRVAGYDEWLKRWGALKAADKARKAREKDAEQASTDFQITRDELRQRSEQWLALGLPVGRELVDGSAGNAGLDKSGVLFSRPADGRFEMRYHLENEAAATTVGLTAQRYEAIRAAWSESRRRSACAERAQEERQSYYFPFAVEGGAGLSGLRLYPQLQTAPGTPDMPLYRD